jgi:hypothetical protein
MKRNAKNNSVAEYLHRLPAIIPPEMRDALDGIPAETTIRPLPSDELAAILDLDSPQAAQLGEQAYRLHRKIVGLRNEADEVFVEIGQLLLQVKEQKLYRVLGFDTFDEYVASPELRLQHTQVYLLLRTVRELYPALKDTGDPTYGGRTCPMTYRDLVEIGLDKADIIRKIVLTAPEEEGAEWVEKAKLLTKLDLRREVRAARGGPTATAQGDYLFGVRQRLMALAARLSETDTPRTVLNDLRVVCDEVEAWLNQAGV